MDRNILIVRADSGCDPTAAVDAVTKLVNVEQVSAIIGPVCSGATIAQAQSVTMPAGVVTLSVSASSPAISSLESGTIWYLELQHQMHFKAALAEQPLQWNYGFSYLLC